MERYAGKAGRAAALVILLCTLDAIRSQAQPEDTAGRAVAFKECAIARKEAKRQPLRRVKLPGQLVDKLLREEIDAGYFSVDDLRDVKHIWDKVINLHKHSGFQEFDPSIFYKATRVELDGNGSAELVVKPHFDPDQFPWTEKSNDYLRGPQSTNMVWIFRNIKGTYVELFSAVTDLEGGPFILGSSHDGIRDICTVSQNILSVYYYNNIIKLYQPL